MPFPPKQRSQLQRYKRCLVLCRQRLRNLARKINVGKKQRPLLSPNLAWAMTILKDIRTPTKFVTFTTTFHNKIQPARKTEILISTPRTEGESQS